MTPPDRRTFVLGLGGAAIAGSAIAQAVRPSYDHPRDIYAALRGPADAEFALDGGTIRLVYAKGTPRPDDDAVSTWVRNAASAVSAYFGNFPVRDFRLLIVGRDEPGVGHATTYGFAGSITRIEVGAGTDAREFADDWVLVHEIMHVSLPDLPRRALWLQEGNATYVEPVVRARAGQLAPAEVWRQAVAGLPKGQPRPGDGGLDGTADWGRLYWGGCAFWLRAEIEIYRTTGGQRSLRDALRRINRESGGNSVEWEPGHLIEVGDAATGGTVLRDLYARYAHSPVQTDLRQLFWEIGVGIGEGGAITLDDTAPLAAFRHWLVKN